MQTNQISVLVGGVGKSAQMVGEYLMQKGMKVKNVERNPLMIQYEVMTNRPDSVLISYKTKLPISLCELLKSIDNPPFILFVTDEECGGFGEISKYVDAEIRDGEDKEGIYRILSEKLSTEKTPDTACYGICSGLTVSDESQRELHIKITEILTRLCITPKYNGYNYLREAIKLAACDCSSFRGVSKQIYPELAVKFGVTASGVERSIRTAIHKSWEKSDPADRVEIFGIYAVESGKIPTNSEFIYIIADKLCCDSNLFR